MRVVISMYMVIFERVFYMKLQFYLSCNLQVGFLGPKQLEQSWSNISESSLVGGTNTESFE
jgi:hypothetical protein